VRVLFELEERLGTRILETLYEDGVDLRNSADDTAETPDTVTTRPSAEARQAQGVK
jgi:hypothetical protein